MIITDETGHVVPLENFKKGDFKLNKTYTAKFVLRTASLDNPANFFVYNKEKSFDFMVVADNPKTTETVEEAPKPDKPEPVKHSMAAVNTGDRNNLIYYIGFLAGAVILVIALAVRAGKKKRK